MSDEKVWPFDSFSAVYKWLILAGYYKLLNKPKYKFIWIGHQIYRVIAFVIVVMYNVAHIIFIIQRRHIMDDVFDASVIEIPQINLLVKFLVLNWYISRVDRINKLINEPIFAAYSKEDEELLTENKRNMHRIARIMNISVTISAFCWPCSHFGRRYQDPTAVVTIYVPFETDTWAKFSYSVILEVILVPWTGYGHIALDMLIATYYAQAEVQLKIIKYNLEHLFDSDENSGDTADWQYKDIVDEDLRKRFVHCVQRYEAVAWFTKEITSIFNASMSFQFFTCSATLCVVIYRITLISVISMQFVFLTGLLLLCSTQVFLYCYFANLVQYESNAVVNSVYLSNWQSASPRIRRLLLIAMLRWSRALTPKVFGFIPLSLNTFISIIKSAYSLYAVLCTKQ